MENSQTKIDLNFKKILKEIGSVQLIAVSKKQPIEKIQKIYNAGQRVFAENYIQELLQKKEKFSGLEMGLDIRWHLVGPVQSNKVSKIVGNVDLIHSVDSVKLVMQINEVAKKKNITQKILIQVNVANEKTKSGVDLKSVRQIVSEAAELNHIKVCGLMGMPPQTDNPDDSRIHFKKLKQLQLNLSKEIETLKELSMGTTQDYKVAIEEGATMVRIGEALFGPRN